MNRKTLTGADIEIRRPTGEDPGSNPMAREGEILTPEALDFLAALHERFHHRRAERLAYRHDRRKRLAGGYLPHFRPDGAAIRDDDSWRVAPIAPGLAKRHVEITGPTERKMTINALNSGADCWLADLEDANTPHWANVIGGQINLYDAIRETISYTAPTGKKYTLGEGPRPTIIVRPRGWHMTEKHLRIGGHSTSASLTDFGLYFFHNAAELIERGVGPYFYLPKMENREEAKLWADVFTFAEDYVEIDHGTIRATCLIETIMAPFEMEEILWELREYSAGLNAGRWDYIFSAIKKFRDSGPKWVLPDRGDITMTVPFMRAYTELLVRTCHKRGAHAIGGMSAFIPSKDPEANAAAEAKVREDKGREADDGFDGSWVAHPGMVGYVREVFDAKLGDADYQIARTRDDVKVNEDDLLAMPRTPGAITDGGVRTNISVGIRYLASWIGGNGAAAINGLMEDAATAEISRSQIWQWLHHSCTTEEGNAITSDYVRAILAEERERFLAEVDGDERAARIIENATEMFAEVCLAEQFPTFLTIPAYAAYIE
ncbi:malate synthase A [Nanchangia anserum]|uniref:Malate synthase n=1 Tax=Nanchangia anserum TaxID=2692125 RepID=A0A8I0GAB8_9ACTO|nr:malate synthase A [Nanchangia anserum]MBD3689128.1 malate synthase A [Nanchangia anserum]QOX81362.1 malate synthase A [Nanchangia anserum]